MSRTRRLEPPTASGSVGVPERAPKHYQKAIQRFFWIACFGEVCYLGTGGL